MNRPFYFTKYLPVPGPIAIGDKYINRVFAITDHYKHLYSRVGDHVVEERTPQQDNGRAFNGSAYSKKTRVKLFMCLRDVTINIGDKVWIQDKELEYGEVTVLFHNEVYFSFKHNKRLLPCDYELAYKAVGEVSEDALSYVQAGKVYIPEFIQKGYSNEFTKNGKGYKEFVRVKGPCGHFH